ncbi:MAG: ATP-dependent permease [Ramalina farinacea]|uniref:ATP-dependent permease n=1 Tax=Ramalina farinacea TaxID=258253 RepID=A0AA43QU68_9LECA|nr:ATP-dependent permease [Ramalina farinacea]
MLKKEIAWFDARRAGVETFVSRLQTQIRELQTAASQPLAVFLAWTSARIQPGIDGQAEALSDASKHAGNAFTAIDTVKCYNGQDFEILQYAEAVKRAGISYMIQTRANALQIGFVRFTTRAMFAQGFWFGIHLVSARQKSPGDIVAGFMAALIAAQSIHELLPQIIVLEKGRTAGATLRNMKNEIIHVSFGGSFHGTQRPLFCQGHIELQDVSFAYPSRSHQSALDSINLVFPAGKTTFVVGSSGSGKSTLVNLLLGFYGATTGDIFVDGIPVTSLDIGWLRRNITCVQQQGGLFDETVTKNVALGHQAGNLLTKSTIMQSLDFALLSNTICDLPNGLETQVGYGGNQFSGGQKQRINLARAWLRDTPILLLDEATSALDSLARSSMMRNIREWRQGKTTIIITHEKSQVHDDDFVYVLESGSVSQQGFKHQMGLVSDAQGVGALEPLNSLSSGPGRHDSPLNVDSGLDQPVSDSPGAVLDMSKQILRKHGREARSSLSIEVKSEDGTSKSAQCESPVDPALPLIDSSRSARVDEWRPYVRTAESCGATDSIELRRLDGDKESKWSNVKRLADPWSRRPGFSRVRSSSITSTASSSASDLGFLQEEMIADHQTQDAITLKAALFTIWPSLLWTERIVLMLGFVFAAITAMATPAFSWVFSKLLATFYVRDSHEQGQQAMRWSLSILAIATVDATASSLMHFSLEKSGQAWVDSLRMTAFRRIIDQPRAWFDQEENRVAELIETLDRNPEEVRNLLGRFAGHIFVAILMLSISISWSLLLNWKITLVTLSSLPFLYILTHSFESISTKWETRSNDASTITNKISLETFSNIRTVRAYNLEAYFHTKYLAATTHALKTGLYRASFSGLFFGLSDSAIIFITALIYWVGARLASSNPDDLPNILTVLSLLLFGISSVQNLIAYIPQRSSSLATATSLLRLANLPSHEHTRRHHRRTPPRQAHPITFTNISFAYPTRPTIPTLSNVSLTLQSGIATAIVGPSGSGKSTIAALLLGLYPPSAGTITLGAPSSDTELHAFRARCVAVCPQSPHIFPTSIAGNIAYPDHHPDGANSRKSRSAGVRHAAKMVGLHAFITTLPNGYDTTIGPGGTGLSGGQAQRVGVARAVFRVLCMKVGSGATGEAVGAPGAGGQRWLVLDEATSALDQGNVGVVVKRVVRGLAERGVGVVVITHDERVVGACEEVVVIGERGEGSRQGGVGEFLAGRLEECVG